jgi:flagellar biosynthesis protein FliR
MLIRIESQWLLLIALISVRLGAFLWATPLFSLGTVPARVRLMIVLMFSVGLAAVAPTAGTEALFTTGGWLRAAILELAVGSLMAFGVHCAFAAFSFGGRLLDTQMGFGVASLINPSSNEQEPLLGTALLAVGVLTFYLLDGHHLVARAMVQSFQWFPVGRPLSELSLQPIVAQFGLMFSLGTVLVAPVVAVLLLIDIALAMVARAMPQMNVFMLSIPVKIAVGLMVLAISASFMQGVLRWIYESIFAYWQALVP